MPINTAETSVIIPALNEAASIGLVVGDLVAAARWREILVIDDGSTDQTCARAAAAGARVVRHTYNKGNGAAVKTGIRQAPGRFVLIADADDDDARVHEGRLQRPLRARGCRAARRRFENPDGPGRRPVLSDPAESDHDLQPAAPLPARERCGVPHRCRIRGVDDHHAVARDELVGAADSAERGHPAGRARLRTDLVAAVRRPQIMKLPTPLVVVPTYNERDNLPLLATALMQYPNVSLLVVDDESPDGTGAVADALARQYPERIEVLHRKTHRG